MIIKNHKLEGDGVEEFLCKKTSGPFANPVNFIVIHYTAGASRKSSVNYFVTSDTKSSAHLVVGRDEKITQLVDFDTIAWHAGESTYKCFKSLNSRSIGIEIDNAGPLTKRGDGFFSWWGEKYPEIETVLVNGTYWHAYTAWQLTTTLEICRLLSAAYPSIYDVCGHFEIAPGRKLDPGPHFPLASYREHLFGDTKSTLQHPLSSTVATVDVDLLNVRTTPTENGDLAIRPLKRGASVKVLSEAGGWSKVEISVEAWVKSQFLKKS